MSVLRLHLQHKIIKTAFSGKLLLAPYRENGSYFVLDSGVGAGETYSVIPPSMHSIMLKDHGYWMLALASPLQPSFMG